MRKFNYIITSWLFFLTLSAAFPYAFAENTTLTNNIVSSNQDAYIMFYPDLITTQWICEYQMNDNDCGSYKNNSPKSEITHYCSLPSTIVIPNTTSHNCSTQNISLSIPLKSNSHYRTFNFTQDQWDQTQGNYCHLFTGENRNISLENTILKVSTTPTTVNPMESGRITINYQADIKTICPSITFCKKLSTGNFYACCANANDPHCKI